MGRLKKVGPAGGLAQRYGATVRKRYIQVISGLKKAQICPRCHSNFVHRQSVGIWKCRKCSYTFTGGAYKPTTKLGVLAKRTAKSTALKA